MFEGSESLKIIDFPNLDLTNVNEKNLKDVFLNCTNLEYITCFKNFINIYLFVIFLLTYKIIILIFNFKTFFIVLFIYFIFILFLTIKK